MKLNLKDDKVKTQVELDTDMGDTIFNAVNRETNIQQA